jgi:SRSO17 transposase
VGEVEMALRRAGKGYVLGVTGGHSFGSWGEAPAVAGTAAEIAAALPASRYVRLSAGDGAKGPRLYDWAYLALADLAAEAEGYPGSHGIWTRGLLIRRSLTDQDLTFFATWCPRGTPIETLVKVEGTRWAIEDAFETAKNELGLDHNETRSWHGWHRHVALVLLAFALLAVLRHKAEADATPPKSATAEWCRRWCDGPSRRSGALPAA